MHFIQYYNLLVDEPYLCGILSNISCCWKVVFAQELQSIPKVSFFCCGLDFFLAAAKISSIYLAAANIPSEPVTLGQTG